jgi:hypothetical protein
MFEFSDLFGMEPEVVDDKYTTKVNIPQYLPSSEKPPLEALFDDKKYRELMTAISLSSVSEEEKAFLRLAASRHIVFTYAKIADYYAHSGPEMQKLMEQSALVIIDIDDAIANGYVRLSKNIEKIMKATGRQAGES